MPKLGSRFAYRSHVTYVTIRPVYLLIRDLLHEPMVWAGAVRHIFALVYNLRAVYAAHVAAMVKGHLISFEVLMALVGAISNLAIAFPIADTFLTAKIGAKVDRFKNHIFGSNLRPDHVVEQTVVIEIPLKRSHVCEIILPPFLQKSATLFICHGLFVVGHQHPQSDNLIHTALRGVSDKPTFGGLGLSRS